MTRQAGVREKSTSQLGAFGIENNPFVKVVSQETDTGISKRSIGRPFNASLLNRPDLRHEGRNIGREFPATNNAARDERGHDVNDEMLAKEYRRGLRVRSSCRGRCDGLGFIVGECHSVVRPQ